MNLWLLTTEYPPFHGGGIGTYCGFTARMFAGRGDRVHVFVPDDTIKGHHAESAEPGITVVRFNPNGYEEALGYVARLSYAFAQIVRSFIREKGAPDLIEAQDYLGIAYYLTQYRRLGYEDLAGTPIVLTLHSPAFLYLEVNRTPTYRFPDFWTGEMEKQSIRAADLLISPSRWLMEEIRKTIGLGDVRIELLRYPYEPEASGVAIPGPDASASPVKGSHISNKIVFYGKLSPQKGSFELLGYFRELWDKGFAHPLHIIGGTDIIYHPERKTMGQIVRERYAAYVRKGLLHFHGKIRPEQIADHLSDAHVILVPSRADNLPYVVIEAMALGKVVLASRQGGQREMIEDGVSGFLFDHEHPSSFSDQLNKILSLSQQDIDRIGKNALRTVKEAYAPDMIYNKKRDLLRRVVASSLPSAFPFLHQERITPGPASNPNSHPGRLSVVIPYYNMGAYIRDCLRSIGASTFKDIEIIIVDDGSTDPASIDAVNKLAHMAGQAEVPGARPLTLIRQPNRGLAHARNRGAEAAGGEYLAFLDADDMVAPEYYAKAIGVLEKNSNVFFAGCWVQYFENSRAVWPTFTPQPPYALVHNPVNSSALVYKRHAFLSAGLNDAGVDYGLEDFDSVIGMMERGLNGVVLPEVLFHYRVRSGSMFRDIPREKLLYSNKYIVEKHAAYYAKFAAPVINLLNANGPGYLYDNPSIGVSVSVTSRKESALMIRLKNLAKRNEKLKKILLTLKNIKK